MTGLKTLSATHWTRWLGFELLGRSDSGKTFQWTVVSRHDRSALGEIRYYPRWRCYAFMPFENRVFERQCLRDIADFCVLATEEHRQGTGMHAPNVPRETDTSVSRRDS